MWIQVKNAQNLKQTRKILRTNLTKPEQVFWNKVKSKQFFWLKFRRQYSIWRYILDFYCHSLKICIEIDWDSHFENDAIEYDKIRTEFLESAWIKVIRFTNKEIMDNIEGVMETLEKELID